MKEQLAVSKERLEDCLQREMTPDEEFIFTWAWMDGKKDGFREIVIDYSTKQPPGGSV